MTTTPAAPAPDPVPGPTTFRARSSEDLIAIAPILMGFHPADSVVMITGDARRQFHARSGLPQPGAPPGWSCELAETLLGPALRNGVRTVAFLFYSGEDGVVRRAWGTLRRRCEREGIQVLEALRVDGRRYYPLLAGAALREVGFPYDVSNHPFLAQAVLDGRVVERDRDALVASAAPDPEAQASVERALDASVDTAGGPPATDRQRRLCGEWVRSMLGRHLRAGTRLTDEEVARAAWVLQDPRVRQAAWTLMTMADAQRHADLWRDVVRRAPDRLGAAPAALFGWAAWLAGNGALAWAGVDRCRDLDPDHPMAKILADTLEIADPPEASVPAGDWTEGLAG